MAFRKKDPSDSPPDGLRQEFLEFLKDSGRYLCTRGELFGIEAKEAAEVYRRKFRAAGCGFVSLALGYLLTTAAVVGILGSLFAGAGVTLANWTGASLVVATLHFVVAVIALRRARQIGRQAALFEYTSGEFRNDQQWLNPEKKN